jgi:protein-tyrosine phosphatase
MDMRARQVSPDDLRYFDLIAVMDHDNLRDLSHVRGYDQARVRLARSFAPDAAGDEVPDPYYGGPEGFERVADMLEAACEGILDHLFGAF